MSTSAMQGGHNNNNHHLTLYLQQPRYTSTTHPLRVFVGIIQQTASFCYPDGSQEIFLQSLIPLMFCF